MELKLEFARDTGFSKKLMDELIDLSTTAEELDIQSYAQLSQVTDQDMLSSKVTKIKALYFSFKSVDTSSNDDPVSIAVKINASAEITMDHGYFRAAAVSGDYLDIATLTFTNPTNFETDVNIIILGDN